MRKFLSNLEDILKRQRRNIGIKTIERRYGIPIQIYRQAPTVHSKVMGTASGQQGTLTLEIIGLISKDDFFAFDAAASGAFQEGWLYTSYHEQVLPGDTVVFQFAGDTKSRKYKVMFKEGLGQTTEIFPRFRLSALGG